MSDDLVKRLRSMHWCVTTETNGVGVSDRKVALEAADRIEALTAERDRLREALHQIEITCDEEVCVRTAGMSEAALGKSRILPLLQIPRNIARAALKGETP